MMPSLVGFFLRDGIVFLLKKTKLFILAPL